MWNASLGIQQRSFIRLVSVLRTLSFSPVLCIYSHLYQTGNLATDRKSLSLFSQHFRKYVAAQNLLSWRTGATWFHLAAHSCNLGEDYSCKSHRPRLLCSLHLKPSARSDIQCSRKVDWDHELKRDCIHFNKLNRSRGRRGRRAKRTVNMFHGWLSRIKWVVKMQDEWID